MENLFQEECTLSKDSVERYGIAMKKHAQEWVAEIEQMFMLQTEALLPYQYTRRFQHKEQEQ